MPKMTLLAMVQDVLSDMDSDEVNSISDSIEAQQVAAIAQSTYYNIIDGRDWPHLFTFFQLTASGTTSRPTHMSLPERISEVSWVKYNCREITDTQDKYRKMIYKTPEDFMAILDTRISDATEITVISDPTGISLNIYNDRAPTYYTSFDNEYIIMDAYDVAVDSTLQTSKTQCYGKQDPLWITSDTFIPDLPANSFSYLLNEIKSTASLKLKQVADQKAEQHSITQRRRQSQQAWRVKGGISYPNYGRKGVRSSRDKNGSDGTGMGGLDKFP